MPYSVPHDREHAMMRKSHPQIYERGRARSAPLEKLNACQGRKRTCSAHAMAVDFGGAAGAGTPAQ